MPEVRVIDSLAGVAPSQWDALFPGQLEGYDYLRAVEEAGLGGFRWRYVLVEEAGRPIAAAPGFLTEYALETTLSGPGRRMAEAVRRLAPNLLTPRLACLGSPCAETAGIGFHPSLAAADQPAMLRRLIAAFEADAVIDGCSLFGIKDLPAAQGPLCDTGAGPLGYRAIPGQPAAELAIDFPNLDAYLARLSPAARKDMRRKLRSLASVRIEVAADIAPVLDQVIALYRQTRARAEMTFEELTPAYFQGVLARMLGRASCVLYYADDELLAANLLLHDGDTLLDKFFCMDAARGRALNLYFLSWFTNVRLCLERGIGRYQSGQAGYETKLRLGSRLAPTANWFRHRNALVNGGLRLVAPLFAADPTRQAA